MFAIPALWVCAGMPWAHNFGPAMQCAVRSPSPSCLPRSLPARWPISGGAPSGTEGGAKQTNRSSRGEQTCTVLAGEAASAPPSPRDPQEEQTNKKEGLRRSSCRNISAGPKTSAPVGECSLQRSSRGTLSIIPASVKQTLLLTLYESLCHAIQQQKLASRH